MSGLGPDRILIDTGPIVAIFNPQDSLHRTCVEALGAINGTLYTCWPVLTEAAYLLIYSQRGLERLLNSLGGFVQLLQLEPADAKAIAVVLKRYENIHPQLADAALVHLAGREAIDTIFTLDRRDFSVYRTSRGRALRIIPQSD
jgi:uncharacterized protein